MGENVPEDIYQPSKTLFTEANRMQEGGKKSIKIYYLCVFIS